MGSIIKRIEYFKLIFDGIDLNVRSKISDEIEEMFMPKDEYENIYREPSTNDLLIELKILEEALKDAKKELKDAKRDVKKGVMSEDDLYNYKCAVDELLQSLFNSNLFSPFKKSPCFPSVLFNKVLNLLKNFFSPASPDFLDSEKINILSTFPFFEPFTLNFLS